MVRTLPRRLPSVETESATLALALLRRRVRRARGRLGRRRLGWLGALPARRLRLTAAACFLECRPLLADLLLRRPRLRLAGDPGGRQPRRPVAQEERADR